MSVQRFAMDPRSGKYAEPMDVALAVTILSEMADEWSWDDDPHGYCHTRRPIVALLNAHDDHERALAEAVEAERERAHATFMRHYGHDTEKLSSAPAPVPSGGNDGRERQPRILPADDPEPGVGSVVLDALGRAWQRHADVWVYSGFLWDWRFLASTHGPLRLIHDGGQA